MEEGGLLLLLPGVRVPPQAVVGVAEPAALQARLRYKVNAGSQEYLDVLRTNVGGMLKCFLWSRDIWQVEFGFSLQQQL